MKDVESSRSHIIDGPADLVHDLFAQVNVVVVFISVYQLFSLPDALLPDLLETPVDVLPSLKLVKKHIYFLLLLKYNANEFLQPPRKGKELLEPVGHFSEIVALVVLQTTLQFLLHHCGV